MQLVADITVINGLYNVQVGIDTSITSPFTQAEQNAINQLGGPVIECGGHFTGTVMTHALDFTLPSNQLRFPTQFPVIQQFDVIDPLAEYNAILYKNTITTAITTAMTTLVSTAAGLGGTGHWSSTIATS